MRVDLHDCELCLADNVPLRLSGARGVTVRCTAGRVWLTIAGEWTDIFLTAGQSHTLSSNRLVLVEAVRDGSIRLESPPGRRRHPEWRRLASALLGGFPNPFVHCG